MIKQAKSLHLLGFQQKHLPYMAMVIPMISGDSLADHRLISHTLSLFLVVGNAKECL